MPHQLVVSRIIRAHVSKMRYASLNGADQQASNLDHDVACWPGAVPADAKEALIELPPWA